MATTKIVILKHQQREDKTWNVKIRITHDRKSAYIPTSYYVNIDLINKKTFELKERNNPVYDSVMVDVLRIRQEFNKLGRSIEHYTAKGLCALMQDVLSGKSSEEINFFDYAEKHIQKLKDENHSMWENFQASINHLYKYLGNKNLNFSDITSVFLRRYDEYLHNIDSQNGTGKISDSGVRLYIGKIQRIFNLAKLEYNDDESGIIRISNDPFQKYKIPKSPITRKRAITAEQIRAIKDLRFPVKFTGTIIARDVFIMSFLLAGMNTVDMFYVDKVSDGRVEYERRKTRTRRADNAFISVRIEPELIPYMDRYRDLIGDRAFNFFTRYASHDQFNHKVNENLKMVGKEIGLDNLSFYSARHSWATIARNECGISMDDVAFSLNHKSGHNITDTYIKKDWSIIDRANRKVIDFVFGKDEDKKAEE
jgi:integrase